MERAAVHVGALVVVGREEVGGDAAGRAVDLQHLEPGLFAAQRRVAEFLHQLVDLLDAQGAGHFEAHLIPGLEGDGRSANHIGAAHKGGVPAGVSQLHPRHGPVLFQRVRQQGEPRDEFVLVRPQPAGGHGHRHRVIHENQPGAALRGFGVCLDLTVGDRTVGVAQIGAHGVAHDAVFDHHIADPAFFKQLGVVLVCHVLEPSFSSDWPGRLPGAFTVKQYTPATPAGGKHQPVPLCCVCDNRML